MDPATKNILEVSVLLSKAPPRMLLYSVADCFMIIKWLPGETGAKTSSFIKRRNELFLGEKMVRNFVKFSRNYFVSFSLVDCYLSPGKQVALLWAIGSVQREFTWNRGGAWTEQNVEADAWGRGGQWMSGSETTFTVVYSFWIAEVCSGQYFKCVSVCRMACLFSSYLGLDCFFWDWISLIYIYIFPFYIEV